jgi:hypothetical protein
VSNENEVVTEDAVVAEAPAEAVAEVVEEAPATESAADDKDARIAELEAELAKAKAPFMAPDAPQGKDESDAMYAKRMKKFEEEKKAALKKSAPEAVVKMLEDLEKSASEATARAAAAEATLKKERDDHADAEAVAKAKNWNNLPLEAEKVGPALRQLSLINEDLAKSIEGILEAVNAQAKTSNLFAEIGKSVDASTDAYSRMSALAKAAVESGVAKSMEQAMADVAIANADLYSQYLSEKGAK